MKAVIHTHYGPAENSLQVRDIDKPIPGDGEVLIRIHAASMHADIWHAVEGLPYVVRLMGNGVHKPKRLVPGTDLAGVIEAVGNNVTRFKIGDEVFGESTKFGWHNGGAYAEYAAVPEEFLALKPSNVSFAQAAAVPTSGYIALTNIGSGDKSGQSVLINGAGGAMGSLAIQLFKAQGARVTAVDCAAKLPLMRLLGADRVIDYAKVNYLDENHRYDFILDIPTLLFPKEYQHALTTVGRYVAIGHADYGKATGRLGGRIVGSMPYFVLLLLRAMLDAEQRKRLKFLSKQEAMATFKAFIESGKLTPVVAHTFPLSDVAGAMQRMKEGQSIGRIIILPQLN